MWKLGHDPIKRIMKVIMVMIYLFTSDKITSNRFDRFHKKTHNHHAGSPIRSRTCFYDPASRTY